MSATKRDSIDGVGSSDRDYGYEQWSDGLPPIDDEDLEQMAAEWEAKLAAESSDDTF